MLSTELEDKIQRADKVELHYRPPYETKYAVVEYYCRYGKPLRVASYYTYGEEFKSGRPLICWHWLPSTNFNVIEDDIADYDAAKLRLKELRRIRNETCN